MDEIDVLKMNIRHLEAELVKTRLTLRDKFAMAALQGMLAKKEWDELYLSEKAYWLADDMMAQRTMKHSEEE